ncbi:MAG: hypothetical protein OEY03_06105 [Rhizobacter sp.]|nr:hypothetical protein [Rhizobacter sp.]
MWSDPFAQSDTARWLRIAVLLAAVAGLTAWWLQPGEETAPALDPGPSSGMVPTTPTASWYSEVAKDPFGARDWGPGTAPGWVAPAVVPLGPAARPSAVAPAAEAPPRQTAAPPPPVADGDNAPGIGLEPAPEHAPE